MLTGLGVDQRFSRTTSAGTETYLTDALGSTVALVDQGGQIQTSYSYEPFGKTTVTGLLAAMQFDHVGDAQDDHESGLATA